MISTSRATSAVGCCNPSFPPSETRFVCLTTAGCRYVLAGRAVGGLCEGVNVVCTTRVFKSSKSLIMCPVSGHSRMYMCTLRLRVEESDSTQKRRASAAALRAGMPRINQTHSARISTLYLSKYHMIHANVYAGFCGIGQGGPTQPVPPRSKGVGAAF